MDALKHLIRQFGTAVSCALSSVAHLIQVLDSRRKVYRRASTRIRQLKLVFRSIVITKTEAFLIKTTIKTTRSCGNEGTIMADCEHLLCFTTLETWNWNRRGHVESAPSQAKKALRSAAFFHLLVFSIREYVAMAMRSFLFLLYLFYSTSRLMLYLYFSLYTHLSFHARSFPSVKADVQPLSAPNLRCSRHLEGPGGETFTTPQTECARACRLFRGVMVAQAILNEGGNT